MKIIEALKKIKDLQRKASDLQDKIVRHCADLDCETPIYPDQKTQVSLWLQAHDDIVQEILKLRTAIQRTNLATMVTIELGGNLVTKCIAEWIHRRKDLSQMNVKAWQGLSDRGLKENATYQLTPSSPVTPVRRRLYFDPVERDRKLDMYKSEPSTIDGRLEIANAETDLILN